MLANVVSVIFAAPLAAGLMRIDGGGLKGWQWLFLLEGIPSVLLGVAMLVSKKAHVIMCPFRCSAVLSLSRPPARARTPAQPSIHLPTPPQHRRRHSINSKRKKNRTEHKTKQFLVPNGPLDAWFLDADEARALHLEVRDVHVGLGACGRCSNTPLAAGA